MSRTFALALLGGIVGLAANLDSSPAAENKAAAAALCIERPGVLVIAHRGDSKAAPENTLPAFESALKVGADLVELDYHHSADGVPVVIHDSTLDRTTNAVRLWGGEKIKLEDKPLAELRKLDAGKWFGAQFAGTAVPTLEESLDLIQSGSMTLVERKGGDPATCVALLKRKQLLDQVVVQAFDWDYLAGCHRLAPDLVLGALGHKEFTPDKLDQIAATGARVVGWEDRYTSAETIRAIHGRGWKAWVWTVDSPERATELVRAKVDGIITNRPALIRKAVEAASASR